METEHHLWVGGRIYTGTRWAEALLTEGSRIIFVGRADAVRSRLPQGSTVHRFRGLLLPGLVDAHLHLGELVRRRASLDLCDLPPAQVRSERLAEYDARGSSRPVVAVGPLQPGSIPREAAESPRPWVIVDISGHSAWANRAALRTLGIDAHTPDPPGGFLHRRGGEPTGEFMESAVSLLEPLRAAAATRDASSMRTLLGELQRYGLTLVGAVSVDRKEASMIRESLRGDHILLQVRSLVCWEERDAFSPDEWKRSDPDVGPNGRAIGVKAFLDGAFGPRSAHLTEPYTDMPGESGVDTTPVDLDAERIADIRGSGRWVALHAIGDRAVARAERLFEESQAGEPRRELRRIEHASLTPPDLIERLGRSHRIVVVQPHFRVSDRWLPERLGPDRSRWAYAFGSLLRAGATVAGSSDAPYDRLDPWVGLAAACEPRPQAIEAAEQLSANDAYMIYTEGGAVSLGEGERGRLLEGRFADFLWTKAPSLSEAISLGAAGVLEVWSQGRPLFGPSDENDQYSEG